MTPLYPEELEAAKAYIRPVDDDDISVMNDVMRARAYLAGAGISLPPAGSARRYLYDGVCHGLALSYYERRTAHVENDIKENIAWRHDFNQLKLTEPPVSALDTSGAEGEK